jgi:hypothetical protein
MEDKDVCHISALVVLMLSCAAQLSLAQVPRSAVGDGAWTNLHAAVDPGSQTWAP